MLLGNTESIEDLGIFVNVSMIESTNAFRRFAGDKSWEQLTFQQQQQIRLAAILEQAYARYGDKLQNNVMTKQERLMEQLKEIKLNLSQAFLPIWDMILPALTRFSESLAWVTEQLARFFYRLRGWDYDERTRGIEDTTDAIQDEGDAYDDLADSAKKARKEIAAFDRLNLLGFDSGSGSGRGGGGGKGGGPSPKPPGKASDIEWPTPDVPPLPRLRLEFDPPNPPDAGIGAVATVVTATVESLTAEVRAKWQQLLADMQSQVVTYAPAIQGAYAVMSAGIRATHEADAAATRAAWQHALIGMKADIADTRPSLDAEWGLIRSSAQMTNDAMANVRVNWSMRLGEMQTDLSSSRSAMITDWSQIQNAAKQTNTTMADVRSSWRQRLSEMLSDLNANRPYMEYGWYLIRQAVRLTVDTLADVALAWRNRLAEMLVAVLETTQDTESAWNAALNSMAHTAATVAASIAASINTAISAINNLRAALGQQIQTPTLQMPQSPKTQSTQTRSTQPQTNSGSGIGLKEFLQYTPSLESMIKGAKNAFGFAFSSEGLNAIGDLLKKELEKPENQAGLSIIGLFSGGGVLSRTTAVATKTATEVLQKQLKEAIESILKRRIAPERARESLGKVVGFANGAVVSGPTLAMVGEYPGARTNPEVISPLSDLESMMDTSRTNDLLARILRAIERGQNVTVTISRNEIGQAATSYINDEARRGRNPLPAL